MLIENEKEILIVRNTTVNRLYDVVMVDYFKEDVEFIVKGVQYDDAVEIQQNAEQSQQGCDVAEQTN
jgi:hypothetical protein|tara:strand:+ start:1326 stop:1526 length:201 start_codon:yes stop_codon:yes gene_type:complete